MLASSALVGLVLGVATVAAAQLAAVCAIKRFTIARDFAAQRFIDMTAPLGMGSCLSWPGGPHAS